MIHLLDILGTYIFILMAIFKYFSESIGFEDYSTELFFVLILKEKICAMSNIIIFFKFSS